MSDEPAWVMINLDEKMARRHGMPPQVPVPKAEFEGLAEKGLNADQVRKWVTQFMANTSSSFRFQHGPLAARLDAYMGKAQSWQKAEEAFSKNDYAKAISALQMVARLDPSDHAAKMNLSMALANTNDRKGALKILEEIAPTFEGESDFHVTFGSMKLQENDREGAIGEMVLALEAKPDNKAALDALVKLQVLVAVYENPKDAGSLTYVRNDSVLSYLRGHWAEAERTLDYYLEQLVYHEGEKRWDVALAAAEEAIALAEKTGVAVPERAALARAALLRAQGDVDASLAVLDTLPETSGREVERGLCRQTKGDAAGARAAYAQALELDAGDQQALVLMFWPENKNDIAALGEAIHELRAHADAHRESAGAWRSLARAELGCSQEAESLAHFEKAVLLAPGDDDLRAEWWAELNRAGRYADVIANAETLGEMRARSWLLRWSEAEAYQGVGKKIEARGAFTAINMDETLHVDVRKRAKRAVQNMPTD